MNNRWSFQKLMDLCFVITDGSHFSPKHSESGQYPMLSVKDMGEYGFSYTSCKRIAKKDYDILVTNGCRPQINDVLVAKDGSYLKSAFVVRENKEEVVLSSIAILRLKTNLLYPQYAAYFFRAPKTKNEVEKHYLTGTAIKRVIIKGFRNITLPIPPIEEQKQIVSELDLISLIIEKKRKQLKELDTLAQSIFYDMFGNPVNNSKGWPINKLEDNCEVSSAKRVLVEDVVDSGIPFIRGTELTALNKATSSKDVQFTMFITPEHYEKLKLITGVPKQGDILIPSINSEGISWIVDTEMPFYFKDGRVIWVHVNPDVFASEYLKNTISVILKANYEVLTSGATFLELKLFIIRELMIPIPPLEFQRDFAQKIQSIEQQKESITHSIAETQKLFDYTMDKYFG